jgi:hypothetical protein
MNRVTPVTPAPSPLQNGGRDSSSLPRLITYDIFENKTPQQLLYEVYKRRIFS